MEWKAQLQIVRQMKWQRNMFQKKEQGKTPEELNEIKIGNLPKKRI